MCLQDAAKVADERTWDLDGLKASVKAHIPNLPQAVQLLLKQPIAALNTSQRLQIAIALHLAVNKYTEDKAGRGIQNQRFVDALVLPQRLQASSPAAAAVAGPAGQAGQAAAASLTTSGGHAQGNGSAALIHQLPERRVFNLAAAADGGSSSTATLVRVVSKPLPTKQQDTHAVLPMFNHEGHRLAVLQLQKHTEYRFCCSRTINKDSSIYSPTDPRQQATLAAKPPPVVLLAVVWQLQEEGWQPGQPHAAQHAAQQQQQRRRSPRQTATAAGAGAQRAEPECLQLPVASLAAAQFKAALEEMKLQPPQTQAVPLPGRRGSSSTRQRSSSTRQLPAELVDPGCWVIRETKQGIPRFLYTGPLPAGLAPAPAAAGAAAAAAGASSSSNGGTGLPVGFQWRHNALVFARTGELPPKYLTGTNRLILRSVS